MDYSKYLIFIIDDESFYRSSLAAALISYLKVRIKQFDEAKEALAAIEKGARPDLILTDLDMPELDGETFAKKLIESDPKWAKKIVPLTNLADESSIDRLVRLGASDYILKGLSLEIIVKKILKLLRREDV